MVNKLIVDYLRLLMYIVSHTHYIFPEIGKMALTTGEFVTAFHTLSGLTIGERRKNLFLMMNDNVDPVCDFTQIKAQTLLEQSLKFEVLKFYKNKTEILEMLKEENPAVIEKIFKLDWFIKETFGSMEGKRLVFEIFPNLSYNSKLKLLNRLCLVIEDSSKCDEFFLAVEKVYGTYFASKLLPACSQILILKALESNKVELTPRQLLLMIKRNSLITEDIFEKIHNYNRNVDIGDKYEYVLKYLMQNDLSTFIRLNEKYTNSFKLGTRTSRKFITNNIDICLTHSEKLYKLLKESQVGKCLGDNFSKFFSNIYPRSLQRLIDNFEYFTSLLDSFKDEDKLNLMFDTFKNHYGGDLLQHHQFMVPKIFEWMSLDYKERWLENFTKPNEISDEIWISFMGIEKSIPLLKDKIALTSNVKERERLVKALVSTCKINKNENAFADVCEYMVNKHRNDQFIVRRAFLEATMNAFDLKKLHNRHWKYINELIRPICINVQCCPLSSKYLEDYIHVCFDNDLPVIEYMKLWLKQSYIPDSIFLNKREYEKRCLEEFLDVLPLCFSGDKLEFQYWCYLLQISDWNKRHPKDKISMFKHKNILDLILLKVEHSGQSYEAQEALMHCIIYDFQRANELNLLEILLTKYKRIYITIDMKWLLKHHSLDILPYMQSLMDHVLREKFGNYKLREIFVPVLDPKVKEAINTKCKEMIKIGSDDCKKRSMVILSIMLTPEDFLDYIEEHCLQDLMSNNVISTLQQYILSCLQNVAPTYLTLSIILKYCQGDFMKYAQNALHRACNNVAEKRVSDLVGVLSTRAVSVRKHSIVLASKLMNKAATGIIIKKFMHNEKNPLLRKNLFKSVFNWFLRNPDDYVWQLVKENIEAIGNDDIEAFCKLANSKRVPNAFFVKYILFAWNTLDKLPYNEKLEEGKCRILESITPDNIASLPNDFCVEVIRNNLFQKSHRKLQNALNLFASQYLIYSGSNCMDEVFTVIKKFSKVSHKVIYGFVQGFCDFFVKKRTQNTSVLNAFSSYWNETLQPCQALENYLYIQFTSIFVDYLKNKSIVEVGGRIGKLCNILFNRQSLDIRILKEVFIDNFISSFLEEVDGNLDENNLLLISSIVKNGNSDACLGLALALIPLNVSLIPKTKIIYDSIFEAAAHNSHSLVQIQLHHYLITK